MTPLIPLHLFLVLLLPARVFSGQTLKKQLSLALEMERRSVLAKADPVAGQQIDVNMWFNLLFIIGLDERQQILTTSGWLDLWWNDDRYIWNSTEYGGIESVMVLHEKVWKPDIVVRNAVNSLGVVGMSDDFLRVFSSGYIEWSPANVYQTICEVDVRTFPFDSQVCYMNISSWVYYADQVRLVPYSKGVILRHYKENSEWELQSLDYEDAFYNFSNNHQNGVTFRFILKRHSVFYVLKILIPTILLSLLNAFVFVVPVESGEKVSISVTTMLSLTVFLSYIGDVTPNNSDNIPVFAMFVVLHLSLGALSIICNIITLNYHFKWRLNEGEGKEVAIFQRISTRQLTAGDQSDLHGIDCQDINCSDEINHNFTTNMNNLAQEKRASKKTLKPKIEYLDKIFFVAFISASLTVTFYAVFRMLF